MSRISCSSSFLSECLCELGDGSGATVVVLTGESRDSGLQAHVRACMKDGEGGITVITDVHCMWGGRVLEEKEQEKEAVYDYSSSPPHSPLTWG